MGRKSGTKASILQAWVGNWVELHYVASSAEVTPHGIIAGPQETRVGIYLLEAIDDNGIEAFMLDPDERRTIFIPWHSVLLVRGPSREELEQSEQARKDGPSRDRQEIMDKAAEARTSSEIDEARAAADDWLAAHPEDGDVRVARERLEADHLEGMDLEEGNPT